MIYMDNFNLNVIFVSLKKFYRILENINNCSWICISLYIVLKYSKSGNINIKKLTGGFLYNKLKLYDSMVHVSHNNFRLTSHEKKL